MKRMFSLALIIGLVLIPAFAFGESFTVKDKNGHEIMPNDSNSYYLYSGQYTISGTTNKYSVFIVENEKVSILLDSAEIDLSHAVGEERNSAIAVGTNAELNIILKDHSENILKGSDGSSMVYPSGKGDDGFAAISNSEGVLTIQCESSNQVGHQCTESCGRLIAVGGSSAAGIGGNSGCDGKNITILGGRIVAKGKAARQELGIFEYSGAGIGGGNKGAGIDIAICGGIVDAEGECDGAGIGGTLGKEGRNITISGGSVNAKGGDFAAGIGGGTSAKGNTITINGGVVTAISGIQAAGIGGGHTGIGTDICITGGDVRAISSFEGAGIGGGTKAGAFNIEISGGNITAIGGECDEEDMCGEGIGRGMWGEIKGGQNIWWDAKDIAVNPSEGLSLSIIGGKSETDALEIPISPISERIDITNAIGGMKYIRIESKSIMLETLAPTLAPTSTPAATITPVPTVDLPKTGDDSHLMRYVALLLMSVAATIVIQIKKRV